MKNSVIKIRRISGMTIPLSTGMWSVDIFKMVSNHLRMTQEGKQWIANLYAHVFAVEHQEP